MAKMRMKPEERKLVKLQCLRMMLTLELDRAKMGLIAGFVNTYLRLPPDEERWVEAELEAEFPSRKEQTMFWTDWHEAGMQQGIQQGMQQGTKQGAKQEALRLVEWALSARLGPAANAFHQRLAELSTQQLEDLFKSLDQFSSIADLERWLDKTAPVS